MTPEDIAEALRAKGYKVDVLQDSININIDSKGQSAAAIADIQYAIQPYQEAMLERLNRFERVSVLGAGISSGNSLKDFERMLIARRPEIICDMETHLCGSPAEPKNLPYYRKHEKKGKRW